MIQSQRRIFHLQVSLSVCLGIHVIRNPFGVINSSSLRVPPWNEQFKAIIVAHNYAQTIVVEKLFSFAKFIFSRRQFRKPFFMIKQKVSTVVVVVHRHSRFINLIIKRAFPPTTLSSFISLFDSCWSFEWTNSRVIAFIFPDTLSKRFEVLKSLQVRHQKIVKAFLMIAGLQLHNHPELKWFEILLTFWMTSGVPKSFPPCKRNPHGCASFRDRRAVITCDMFSEMDEKQIG